MAKNISLNGIDYQDVPAVRLPETGTNNFAQFIDPDSYSLIIPYGEVDSTSTSTAFTASVDGITELKDGVVMYLRNGVVTSASGFTININNLGAKPVYQNLASATAVTTTFNINYTMMFIYNSERVTGGCWDMFYGYNSDTNTIAYNVRRGQTDCVMFSKLYRYQICFSKLDGTLVPANGTSNTTGTSKTLTTEEFNPNGIIIYYSYTTAVNAGSSPSASYCYMQYSTVDARYSFNAGSTLVAKEPVYVKLSPQTNGMVKLAGNDCLVQSLPNSEDGYVYMYLGRAYSTYQITLDMVHPLYYYKDNAVRLWSSETERIWQYLATLS